MLCFDDQDIHAATQQFKYFSAMQHCDCGMHPAVAAASPKCLNFQPAGVAAT
jgi:hypothetical protein